ncbi:hypothetical protein DIJ64_06745 [Mycobacterium leprae]|uniref:Uncharacterized protein n=1 Tax=Mycobacterium leprae TaxID=1769 RepID=A0AAD0KWA5_MYCLR|nr:hypothetical protein [Mycobacterium leprae]AWV47876.1 hypothetical protein DIJ64_06745 [Mycobacterium leprae]
MHSLCIVVATGQAGTDCGGKVADDLSELDAPTCWERTADKLSPPWCTIWPVTANHGSKGLAMAATTEIGLTPKTEKAILDAS